MTAMYVDPNTRVQQADGQAVTFTPQQSSGWSQPQTQQSTNNQQGQTAGQQPQQPGLPQPQQQGQTVVTSNHPLNQAWLAPPSASQVANPATYWQSMYNVHGAGMTPEQQAFIQNAIRTGLNPNAVINGTPGDNRSAMMELLRQRMMQGSDVDPNDPRIKGQVENFRASQTRDRNKFLNEAAEQASARGMADSGAMNVERRMADEATGLNTAKFQDELVTRELTARRNEIQHAIDTMGAQLTEQERQVLQRELSEADNSLRRYGIDTQNSQFFAGLGQADRHFLRQLAQSERFGNMDDAFRWAQLGQSGDQFRDQMGFNLADRQNYWDAIRRGIM